MTGVANNYDRFFYLSVKRCSLRILKDVQALVKYETI